MDKVILFAKILVIAKEIIQQSGISIVNQDTYIDGYGLVCMIELATSDVEIIASLNEQLAEKQAVHPDNKIVTQSCVCVMFVTQREDASP